MTRAVFGPAPKTTCVAVLYRSHPRHACAAAPSVFRLLVSGTNGAADFFPPGFASSGLPAPSVTTPGLARLFAILVRVPSVEKPNPKSQIPKSHAMPEFGLILTLATSLAAALVCGYITHRLGLSPIVGYLLAGVAIGPHTPGFIADPELAEQLAEVGVILLMFGVGLQFHVEELLAVRRVAIPGAAAGIASAMLLGAWAAWLFGWGWNSSLVFGLTLSVASTVVLVRVLSDNRQLHTSSGHIAVGWLVVEDVLTVIMLVLLPTLVGGNASRL